MCWACRAGGSSGTRPPLPGQLPLLWHHLRTAQPAAPSLRPEPESSNPNPHMAGVSE